MAESFDVIRDDRTSTHGDYSDMCIAITAIKDAISRHATSDLSPLHRETLHSIALKIGRVITGDPNFFDHWRDIEGYAAKMAEYLAPKAAPGPVGDDPNAEARKTVNKLRAGTPWQSDLERAADLIEKHVVKVTEPK